MMFDVRRAAVACAAAGALALPVGLMPAVPAHAAEVLFTDPNDDLGADIRRVRVVNTGGDLSIRIRFDRLVEDGRARSQALQVFVDTDPGRKGPELQLATGLNTGTDYWLREMKSWTKRGALATCDHSVDLDWPGDRVVVQVSKECLKDPQAPVRIALKARESTKADGASVDWFPRHRTFSAPVGAG